MSALVQMTRRVAFSSGHRYWNSALSADENSATYGPWASPYNHGHNYVLDVTVEGRVDPRTGMVVNIKRIDDVLRERVVLPFDGRSLNDEVPHFATRSTTLENLLTYVADLLPGALPPEARLVRLLLAESPLLCAEYDMARHDIQLTRTYEFAASHRLHSPHLSDEANREVYGKCNNLAGHGHNYVLEVGVSGVPDPRTGMICALEDLDRIVAERVVDRYDHRNLDVDLPEFEGRVTTSETLVGEIFDRLENALPARLERVRLWETARNAFEVRRTIETREDDSKV